jgi:hypothetical protein
MTQNDLSKQQIDQLSRMLFPSLNLMSRLQRRMDEARFPGNDPLYLNVLKAQSVMQELYTRVLYLGCSGVGSPAHGPRVEESEAEEER